MAGLVVVGTLLVDEVLTLAAPALPGTQQRALARRIGGGGQAWHTAMAAARAGADVVVAGRRGDDADGRRLAAALAQAGVTDLLVAAGASRRAVVLAAPPAERAIVSIAGEESQALPADLTGLLRAVQAAGWLHLDGFGLDDSCGPLALAMAGAAVAAGVPVSLEPPSLAGLPARRERLALLPALDLLVGRPDEVAAAGAILCAVPRAVVTHDGAGPVRWSGPDRSVSGDVPPAPDLDTLGAGDRFAGGLLAACLRGDGPADALRAGIAAAHAVRLPPG